MNRPKFGTRTGIREEGGVEIIGERWYLSNTDVRALLAALEHHGRSDTLGAGCARELHERLTGEPVPAEPDLEINECGCEAPAFVRDDGTCSGCGAQVVKEVQ